MTKYCTRTWLNPNDHSFTGSIVCFSGTGAWGRDKPEETMFVEIADSHAKARLHASRFDEREQFVQKVTAMRDDLTKFIEFLSTQQNDGE